MTTGMLQLKAPAWRKACVCACAIVYFALGHAAAEGAGYRFEVKLAESVVKEPFTGRVYVFFSQHEAREPRLDPKFVHAEPFIAIDVKDLKPGETVTLASDSHEEVLAYPVPLAEMETELNGCRAQALVRLNPNVPQVGSGEGNAFSAPVKLPEADGEDVKVELVVDQIVAAPVFKETKWCKQLQVRSKLLSDFHGREVTVNAAVVLPESYDEQPDRRYPVILEIPGFGGTHYSHMKDRPNKHKPQGVEFVRVVLDGNCPLGHHVFADSANNGPWGTALVEEFLPALDVKFQTVAEPTARCLTGVSSGAWSSLWVQINYPDHFAGVWSDAPDPVDFRDFQRINLYAAAENMYVDSAAEPRPIAHLRDRVLTHFKEFDQIEQVQGPGGQLHSFEAVFSPRGADGKPRPLWDRETGKIDPTVAKSWEKYDIALMLRRNWDTLGPKLQGKLHIHVTESETFYLEGAVKLLKETLAELGSDAEVVIHPGHSHGAMTSPRNRRKLLDQMAATVLANHPELQRAAATDEKVAAE